MNNKDMNNASAKESSCNDGCINGACVCANRALTFARRSAIYWVAQKCGGCLHAPVLDRLSWHWHECMDAAGRAAVVRAVRSPAGVPAGLGLAFVAANGAPDPKRSKRARMQARSGRTGRFLSVYGVAQKRGPPRNRAGFLWHEGQGFQELDPAYQKAAGLTPPWEE